MPTKVFTTITGKCPFGLEHLIDSPACRKCQHYWRAGTVMFFWCNYRNVPEVAGTVPKTKKTVPKTGETVPGKRKRGRPPGKAPKKPVNTHKTKKR